MSQSSKNKCYDNILRKVENFYIHNADRILGENGMYLHHPKSAQYERVFNEAFKAHFKPEDAKCKYKSRKANEILSKPMTAAKESTMHHKIQSAITKAIAALKAEQSKDHIAASAIRRKENEAHSARDADLARRQKEIQRAHVAVDHPNASPHRIDEIMKENSEERKKANDCAFWRERSRQQTAALNNENYDYSDFEDEGNYADREGGKLKSFKRRSRKHLSKRSSKRKATRKFRR